MMIVTDEIVRRYPVGVAMCLVEDIDAVLTTDRHVIERVLDDLDVDVTVYDLTCDRFGYDPLVRL